MFDTLISRALPGITEHLQDQLLNQLKGVGKQIATNEIAKQMSRALIKSIDTVVAISVANLPVGDADKLSKVFADEVLKQMEQLGDAVGAYVPMQVAVEVAKQRHGATSPQAAAARKKREVGIEEMREEVRDLLRAATGQDPTD